MRSFINSHSSIVRNIFLFLFAFSLAAIYSSSSGITGKTRLNGSGCTCHGTASSDVSVDIIGPDEVETGETVQYTVRVSGGPAVEAGTNIASSAGEINPVSPLLRKEAGELTHTSPASFSGSSFDFVFSLTAPEEPGELTLFANGNSVNGTGTSSGDAWNFAPDKIVSVTEATGLITVHENSVPAAFTLSQNYPNPFNPVTRIDFTLNKSGFVSLKVYDMLGKEMATLVSEAKAVGTYSVNFDATKLTSGTYFFILKSADQTLSRKMLLMR